MPLMNITSENKVSSGLNFEKFTLDQGETARLVCLQTPPYYDWVHTLRKPFISEGEIVLTAKERRDGSTYEVPKLDFVSRTICMGNPEVLNTDGYDSESCPICALALENPDWQLAAQRRFAMNVFQYNTDTKGKLRKPFHGNIVIWAFTDQIFNKLVDISDNMGGDLRKIDLVVGPCTNKTFQKAEITASTECAWLTDDDTKKLTTEIVNENAYPEEILRSACGRDPKPQFVQVDLNTIAQAWAIGDHSVMEDEDVQSTVSGQEETLIAPIDMGEISKETSTSSAEEVDFDSLLSNLE